MKSLIEQLEVLVEAKRYKTDSGKSFSMDKKSMRKAIQGISNREKPAESWAVVNIRLDSMAAGKKGIPERWLSELIKKGAEVPSVTVKKERIPDPEVVNKRMIKALDKRAIASGKDVVPDQMDWAQSEFPEADARKLKSIVNGRGQDMAYDMANNILQYEDGKVAAWYNSLPEMTRYEGRVMTRSDAVDAISGAFFQGFSVALKKWKPKR